MALSLELSQSHFSPPSITGDILAHNMTFAAGDKLVLSLIGREEVIIQKRKTDWHRQDSLMFNRDIFKLEKCVKLFDSKSAHMNQSFAFNIAIPDDVPGSSDFVYFGCSVRVSYKLGLLHRNSLNNVQKKYSHRVEIVNVPSFPGGSNSASVVFTHGNIFRGFHKIRFTAKLEKNNFDYLENVVVTLSTDDGKSGKNKIKKQASLEIWEKVKVKIDGYCQERSRILASERFNVLNNEYSCMLALPGEETMNEAKSEHFEVSHVVVASLFVEGGSTCRFVKIPIYISPK